MSIALKYCETGQNGSFTAEGIGFEYRFSAKNKTLEVLLASNQDSLCSLDCNALPCNEVKTLTECFEKACQINALIFSNNITHCLPETLDSKKLPAILESSYHLARYALNLRSGDFQGFSKSFCHDYALSDINIRLTDAESAKGRNIYKGSIKTLHGFKTKSCADSIHGIVKKLSEKAITDLMTQEFGHSLHGSAHNLLTASSKLATVSQILNNKFIPVQRIKTIKLNNKEERKGA